MSVECFSDYDRYFLNPFQALGDKAVEVVAEQLGSTIKARTFEHDASVERLAEAHARGKEVKHTEALPRSEKNTPGLTTALTSLLHTGVSPPVFLEQCRSRLRPLCSLSSVGRGHAPYVP